VNPLNSPASTAPTAPSPGVSNPEVQQLFNRIAPVYDPLNDWLSLGQHWVWKGMAIASSRVKAGDTALDLCCGSGDLARLLAREVGPQGRVFGVDFSPVQLQIARDRCKNSPTAISWVEADALHLPFDADSFDAATMGYGLRNVADISQCLRELHRVLKPGATVAILDFHRSEQPWMRQFQQWYLDRVVVAIARQFGLTEEYAYISPSLDRFPLGAEQVALARQAGFDRPNHYTLAGGMMGILRATKPHNPTP